MSGVASAQRQPHVPAATPVEDRARQRDALLVRRCRAGDPSAWPALVDHFSSYVYAIAIGFGLGDDRADDVFQEVFTRVFTRLDSLRDERALKPWIAQLARRVAVDRLRLDARELPSDASTFELAAERDLTEIELAMVVREALDCLDEPFREVIRRFFIADESYRAIGEALELPPGTVASRISRGLVMLREALEEEAQPAAGGDIDG